jgi:hypothetical protein
MFYLIIGVIIVIVDAGLIPSQHIADRSMTIDTLSTQMLPMLPAVPTVNAGQSRSLTKSHDNTSVCYPIVGCFDNNAPYDNAALELPQSPETIDTQFLLFTQEKPSTPEFLSYINDDQSIENSKVNPSRWLRIIIHGFINNRDSDWIQPLRDELLKLGDVSIREDLKRKRNKIYDHKDVQSYNVSNLF